MILTHNNFILKNSAVYKKCKMHSGKQKGGTGGARPPWFEYKNLTPYNLKILDLLIQTIYIKLWYTYDFDG